MTKRQAELKALAVEINARKAALPDDEQALLVAAVTSLQRSLALGAIMDKEGKDVFVDFMNIQVEEFLRSAK